MALATVAVVIDVSMEDAAFSIGLLLFAMLFAALGQLTVRIHSVIVTLSQR